VAAIGSLEVTRPAAVAGLNRSDVREPGLTRVGNGEAFRYLDAHGAEIADPQTIARIRALALPPAWTSIWISPDPLGHIQATGIDSRGRTQYRYHELWRQQRDDEKFQHMLRFAAALPGLRDSTVRDLRRRSLDRGRVAAAAVRLIDLGLFRLGGERYAELDHHYGAATLEKSHVSVHRDGLHFDYVAKEGKHRLITVTDDAVLPTVRALARSDNGMTELFCFRGAHAVWHPLHSHDVSAYIADSSGGHFTAKEFRTWNATMLMALLLAAAGPPASERAARAAIRNSVSEVARWLGDTPAVTRTSYIDPRIVGHYESGSLAAIPMLPARLPVSPEAEQALATLLASSPEQVTGGSSPG
jgi:DNA topoisomerase IB